jgi:RNA polymerase sigma factor (sigma-70 family)
MGTVAKTDRELVEASRRGEHVAFGQLVERYQAAVCAVSYSSTGDWSLSEDVAQDTFLVAWRQLGQLRETARLRPWLCGIARNLARKARRRTRREQLTDDEPAMSADGASPFEATAAAEADQVVREALSRVPDSYREVLVLYYRENRSIGDVASTLGLTEAAALQRLARGRRYLADGVTDLVERSLSGPSRSRRNLVACVLAALPFAAASRVEARPSSHGGTMLKLALVATTLSLTGTAAYVVHHARAAGPPATVTAPVVAAQPTAVERTAPPPAIEPPAAIPVAAAPAPTVVVPEPDAVPSVSAARIHQLGLDAGPSRGPATAPVTLVVFTDAKCKFCGDVLGTIDQLWDEYPGKLKLVVKQFPVHDSAKLAAEASLAAEAQGKFWELHDAMMAHQDDLSRDALISYAQNVGLDVATFTAALDQHRYAAAVKADQAAGQAIEVKGTPAFLINGRLFGGARPIEDFRATIDAALAD